MKPINNIYIQKAVLLLLALFYFTACEKAGDDIYLYGYEDNALVATESKVVLTQETASQVVLSITWTTSTLTVSDPSMHAPDLESIYIQVSTTEDFTEKVTETKGTNLSKAYNGAELNTVAKNLGVEPMVSTPLYFRIRSEIGANTEPKYSNTVMVEVTPYDIDMSIGYILESDKTESPYRLYSPTSDGVYTGFVGAVSWYNFWLLEGDGVTWGNYPEDGTAFRLGSSDDETAPWNCWFPSPGGCYYVVFDTNDREWTALYISELNVSGSLQTEMTFDRRQMQWKTVFNSTAAGTLTIRLSGTGKQYNYTTGTEDDAAVDTPVAFGGSANALSFGTAASDISVTVPGTGEYTLLIDLTDPKGWVVRVQSGSEEPETVYPTLYLPGVDDGISGSWTFDNYISLYDEGNKNYAGVVNVNSLWGYQMAIENENWGDYFSMSEGDANSGSLVFQGENNIPSPDPGLYLIEASLSALTYTLSPVGKQIWVMGMDDNYQFDSPLNATETPGVYTGDINIVENSPWGLEIQMDDSWSHKFGGTDGVLYYKGNNIQDSAVNVPGTYTVTVDLIRMTYSITQ